MKKLYTVVVLIAVLIIGGIGYNMLQANDQGDKQQEAQEDSNQVIQKLLDDKLQYILTKDDNGEITIELKKCIGHTIYTELLEFSNLRFSAFKRW